MRRMFTKKFTMLMLSVCFLGTGVLWAQEETEEDKEQTLRERYSIFLEYAKQRSFEDALPSWRYVFLNAPDRFFNTYPRGEDIIEYMYEKTKDRAYFDTLMMVYDNWMQYFTNNPKYPPAGAVLAKKGTAQARFANGDMELLKQAFNNLSESIEKEGARTTPQTVDRALQIACQLANSNELSRDEFVNLYMKYTDFADQQIAGCEGRNKENYQVCRASLDNIFFGSGLADNNTLVEVLTDKYNKNKEDIVALRQISNMLIRRECTDFQLYTTITEEIYRLDPNADAASRLAGMFLKKEDYARAEFYYKEAIDKSESPAENEVYYLRLGQLAMVRANYQQAKTYVHQVLRINPRSGAAYILLGRAYANAAGTFSKDDYEKRTVYWVAVDKFIQAKQVDPSVAEEANKAIRDYTPQFPTHDMGFFLGVLEGNEVKVNGWINETTKARYNKD